jgi:hypothetical protein
MAVSAALSESTDCDGLAPPPAAPSDGARSGPYEGLDDIAAFYRGILVAGAVLAAALALLLLRLLA